MDFAAEFLDQNRAFGDVIRGADASTPVPTCPGWTLSQLFRHVGRGNRWAAQIVADKLDHPLDPRDVADGKPPEDPEAALGWLHDGAQRLLDGVAHTGADTPVWTFLGPRPAQWWIRRRLHEVTVHRADAALALGEGYELAPDLAADGITEWLERVVIQAGGDSGPAPLSDGQSVHLHATDAGLGESGEWTVSGDGGAISWSHQHGKGSVALRGSARDLLLAIVRRVAVADTDVAVFGDAEVWQHWLDHTPL